MARNEGQLPRERHDLAFFGKLLVQPFIQEADSVNDSFGGDEDPHAGHVDARTDENELGCRSFKFGDG